MSEEDSVDVVVVVGVGVVVVVIIIVVGVVGVDWASTLEPSDQVAK